MKKYETYLPVFPGFYGTIFEADEERETESINDAREELSLEPIKDYDIEFDYEGYRQSVARKCCDFLSDNLSGLGFVSKITMQMLRSPREYNFYNDAIDIVIEMDVKNRRAIQDYIYSHKEEFKKYLRSNYTSCSGFFSSYSNYFEDWDEETGNFYMFKNPGHYLGAILNFICECEEITGEQMYYSIEDSLWAIDFDFETTKMQCKTCGDWYSMRREYLMQTERDTVLLGKEYEPIPFALWVAKNKDFHHCGNM